MTNESRPNHDLQRQLAEIIDSRLDKLEQVLERQDHEIDLLRQHCNQLAREVELRRRIDVLRQELSDAERFLGSTYLSKSSRDPDPPKYG